MATDFQTLQNRVLLRVIDAPTAVQQEVPVLVNEAIRALMQPHNFQVMKAEKQYITDISASNSHIIGQIPDDWKEPRGNSYYVLQQGSTREFEWQPNRAYIYRTTAPFDPNCMGPPRNMLIGEATNDTVPDPDNPDLDNTALNLEIYPYPDGNSDWTTDPAGEYRIRIPYWRFIPELTTATSQNWFTNRATEFIVDFATARAFMLNWDENRASYWLAQAWGPKYDGFSTALIGGWARKAINLDRSMAYSPVKNIAVRRDVYAERDQWRT